MMSQTSTDRPRKRRAINACIACRLSKVRCDGRQPCARCDRNDADCQYHAAGKDLNTIRIEKLEAEVTQLRIQLDNVDLQVTTNSSSDTTQSSTGRNLIQPSSSTNTQTRIGTNAVIKGIVAYDDAFAWFSSFFAGSHYLVPIFSESSDMITSVASRNAFLFDVIVSVGCRAEQGFDSPMFRQLQSGLREHLTNLLVTCEQPPLEAVQAITLMAAYSENGYMLIALALRFATQLGLHKATDQLLAMRHDREQSPHEERELYRLQRVWHGICNLDLL
jgi:hypothetical protein